MQRAEVQYIFPTETIEACKEIKHLIDEAAGRLNSGFENAPFHFYRHFINKKIYEKLEKLDYEGFLKSPEQYILNLTNFFKKHFSEDEAKNVATLIVFAHLTYFQKVNQQFTFPEMVDKLKKAGYKDVPEQTVPCIKDFYSSIVAVLTQFLDINFPANIKNDLKLTYQRSRNTTVDFYRKLQDSYVKALDGRLTSEVSRYLNETMNLRDSIEIEIAELILKKLPHKIYFEQLLASRITKDSNPEQALLKKAVTEAKEEWIKTALAEKPMAEHAKIKDAFSSVRLEELSEQYLKNLTKRYLDKVEPVTQNSSVLFSPISQRTRPIPPTVPAQRFRG